MFLPFPEFLPDLANFDNPGLTVAKNVIPGGTSYKSMPDITPYSNALNDYARGAISTRDNPTGVSYNFTGTGTALYSLGKTTTAVWDNVSKVGGYTLTSDEAWSFTQFGDIVFAVAITETIQQFQMGTSTLFADITTTTGAAPKARYIDTVHTDFLVVGNTFDAVDGFVPSRVRWAGIGSSSAWAVSAVTQADYQDLDAKYGWVTQVVGGDYGIIFQERAITRMDYVGSPAVFQFTILESNQGTRFSKAIIKVGALIFYLGLDGYYVFDGNQSIPIGVDKVNNFFFADFDATNDFRISSAVDYTNRIVIWSYPGVGNINGTPNKFLIYNYAPNAKLRWSYAEVNAEYIFTSLSEGYTLDQLDDWESANGLSKNIDILPYSLDSRIWTGNQLLFGAFNADHKLSVFSATNFLTAVLETSEVQLTPGQRTEVLRFKPMVDNSLNVSSSITCQVGTRNLQSEAVTYTSTIALDRNGEVQCRSNARYHRVRTTITGGFSFAIGFEALEFKPAGYQ